MLSNITLNKIYMYLQESGSLYTGSRACEMIGAPGDDIRRPKLKGYKVFVESKGIGHRPLKKETQIIYHEVSSTKLIIVSIVSIVAPV